MVTVERWKPVSGYEGYYDVSDQGRVRNVRSGRVLKNLPTKNGYLKVNLSKQGTVKTEYVHQLVAKAFLSPRPEGMEVCHGKGGPTDNQASNLRGGTRSENILDVVRDGHHELANRTSCPFGHPLAGPNLVRNHPTRKCLSCARAWSAASKKGLPLDKALADLYYDRLQ